ncbi:MULTISPECIES: response regulator transcription factor [Pseudonocardia]|uniref:Transcriptional regulatory protein DevR (DosR) n=2 Tax=Pseudonocardia TaxID=1847 RepID=A0A1Y2N0G4_PSEAH|nr:response regulator transcription factor [Pseudonocardia saturnea]OSY40920.1 Transcriptional regulatory protein DevR (DosR) [Pseudonocardia autotrophica]TDN73950.1 LuxR family two component transcriptional regulator [Pseudonocardia autotrophica]BBG04704.1 DNA-binding response regulator [Pseudonocardia autotrophica]GEC28755.1 DNA-binding response regulator [Pseudonocardia saturnea]
MALRVVAAEDSYLIREGLAALLHADPELDLVARVPTLPELQRAVADHRPDVVVTDVRMPPGLRDEGIRAAEELAAGHPSTGVVVLSQYVEPDWALRLFTPGAAGRAYLLKERIGDLDTLRRAIGAVAAGGTVLDPQVVEALVAARSGRAASPLAGLTGREREVLELVAEGLSNGAVADRLRLGDRAVEKHITNVFGKLGLESGDDAVHRRVRAVLVYLSATSG